MKLKNSIVSIDGLELKEFDYIDIGAILDTSGAVPVVIKSLIFPTTAGVGKDWKAERTIASIATGAR
jgi:ethanolamine utilization protein EutA